MDHYRIVLAQSPALRLGRWRFGAHNFIAMLAPSGAVMRELHGIARGPGGAQLPVFGGIVPFQREYLWGETYDHRTGFYDENNPQAELFAGERATVDRKLAAASRVEAAVNARGVPYPWPALVGANSNAYCATLIAAMGLKSVKIDGGLWAPSGGRLLLSQAELAEIAATAGERPGAHRAGPDVSQVVGAKGEQQDHRDRHANGQHDIERIGLDPPPAVR